MSGKQSWEELLRDACHSSPGSLYALAKKSGVDEGQLRRFVAGQQSIGIATAEKIGRALGFDLVARKPPSKKQ
jgi:plasmid maintenance system antidote protein VapI